MYHSFIYRDRFVQFTKNFFIGIFYINRDYISNWIISDFPSTDPARLIVSRVILEEGVANMQSIFFL